MTASDIIYDPVSNKDRFPSGMHVTFVETTDTVLKDKNLYYETELRCCSPVKTTHNNWFYLLDPKRAKTERFTAWMKEIIPIFPELDIRVVESKAPTIKQSEVQTMNINGVFDLEQKNSSGYIYIILKLSSLSHNYYATTNNNNFTTMRFDSLTFLINIFAQYCICNRISLDTNNYENTIKQYVSDNIKVIVNDFQRTHYCYVLDSNSGVRSQVATYLIIDFSSINVDNVTEYITEVVKVNISTISRFIDKKINHFVHTTIRPYIQALYSNKAYKVQSYLAHHFIRAGLSDSFNEFIDQYFKIKKVLPKEYFWNLIFLTQFGFKFYYYYWLTGARQFRLTSEKEFMECAHSYNDFSSLEFLSHFSVDLNGMTHNHMRKLYLAGDFKNILVLLNSTTKVRVKPEKRIVLKNLRIAEYYLVLSMDDRYFHVRGDDFRMHRYLKSSFNIIS